MILPPFRRSHSIRESLFLPCIQLFVMNMVAVARSLVSKCQTFPRLFHTFGRLYLSERTRE